jgi:hypothetical protein
MREVLGGAAENLIEPPDSSLMRDVHEVAVAKDIRQAAWGGVHLRRLLRRPKVAPPRHKRQHKENRKGGCYKNCCQDLSLIEVSLQHSGPADVQGHAMGPTAHHFGVPNFQGDDIKTLFLQQSYESRLIPVDHDQIRTNAECIHIDPVTANAFG